MVSGGNGAAALGSGGGRAAHWLLVALLLGAALLGTPRAHAAATDTVDRVAQVRALLNTPQGVALLDLLDDPAVREGLAAASPNSAMTAPAGSVGWMLNSALGDVRAHIIGLGVQLRVLPEALRDCWQQLRGLMPPPALRNTFLYLIAFVVAGIVAQRLFILATRKWAEHFNRVAVETLGQRLAVVAERLTYGTLNLGAFAAGSMGMFLLFNWPASSGMVILGYLWATLLVRFSHLVARFFFAPGAERMRLVPMSTHEARFWHHWLAGLTSIGALGWQTIVVLRGLGLPLEGVELLRQIVLLALAVCGIVIVWAQPGCQMKIAHSARGPALRVLVSVGLVLTWLLFLSGATETAVSFLVIGAVPIALHVLRNAAARVTTGQWPHASGEEVSPAGAIADRCVQALVVVAAAYALVQLWQIDLATVASRETAVTRLARGTFEALVILLVADLLWLVIRAVIDLRLSGAVSMIDNLDGDELRRRARVRTLLPVLRNFVFVFVLIIASLSALAAMGLQIGPLLAGAGVVGIAVGFGAQTLVRDILSGVFFLLDDAFRVGELIESGGISGVVEAFSLRSVKLRHYKGLLHTVPFGDLKAITNYSRDWVNEMMEVTLAFEADLARVEQAIERVSTDVMQEPALASGIISPPVSVGVTSMGAGGIHVGVTVRTRPGQQFRVRAAVFSRLKAAFDEDGIRFAV